MECGLWCGMVRFRVHVFHGAFRCISASKINRFHSYIQFYTCMMYDVYVFGCTSDRAKRTKWNLLICRILWPCRQSLVRSWMANENIDMSFAFKISLKLCRIFFSFSLLTFEWNQCVTLFFIFVATPYMRWHIWDQRLNRVSKTVNLPIYLNDGIIMWFWIFLRERERKKGSNSCFTCTNKS